MKICSKCKEPKEENEFGKRTCASDGLKSECKTCTKLRNSAFYQRNQEKCNQQSKEYYANHVDARKQKSKERRIKKADIIREQIKQWRVSHKEHCKIKHKLRRQNDPLYTLKRQIRSLIYNHIVRYGKYTKRSHTYELLGCSYEDFMTYLGPKPNEDIHLDHICPLDQAQNEEELIKLQHYTNFRWLSAGENMSKNNNKTPEAEEMCRKLLSREWISE